jgi:hypothetical protein
MAGISAADMAAMAADIADPKRAEFLPSSEGGELVFDAGGHKASFAAERFLLSFSLPNFYFHAVTAYDIRRMKGVPIGKRDYLGQMRLKLG